MSKQRIYLAGKVTDPDWRGDLVSGYQKAASSVQGMGIYSDRNDYPILPCAVFGEHDYVGAYAIYDYDPNQHGLGDHAGDIEPYLVARCCRQAIDRASMVFAWIDRPDCYGTIWELGYARAKKKAVYICGTQQLSDLWFVYEQANWITQQDATPLAREDALRQAIAHCERVRG